MEIIILTLVTIGVIASLIIAISNNYSNTMIKKSYEMTIKNQNEIIKNNKSITNNINLFKEHFNKNITDIAKIFDFYDRRIIALEQRQYKRKKKINNDITARNIDDVQ